MKTRLTPLLHKFVGDYYVLLPQLKLKTLFSETRGNSFFVNSTMFDRKFV